MNLLDFAKNLLYVLAVALMFGAGVTLMWFTGAQQDKLAQKVERHNDNVRAGKLTPFDFSVSPLFIVGPKLIGCWFKFGAVFMGIVSLVVLAHLIDKAFSP